MKHSLYLSGCISLLTLPLVAQVVTPPFQQNGTVVTTPATGTFSNATFQDATTGYTVTIAPVPSSGTLALSNSGVVVNVGGGSSISASASVSLTSTTAPGLEITGDGVAAANQINNAATLNTGGAAVDLEAVASTTNTLANSGPVTSGGSDAVMLNAPGSIGSNMLTNSGQILATAGSGLYLFGDSTPTNTESNTATIQAAQTGLYFSGNSSTKNTLTNSGMITATHSYGIDFTGYSASQNIVTNSGTIQAPGLEGIEVTVDGGRTLQITNSGTVTGGGGAGIDLQVEGVLNGTTLLNTGQVTGSTNGISVAGSGSGPSSFTNTARVTGQGGSAITIDSDGSTSNTVVNSGNLQGTTEGLNLMADGSPTNSLTNSGVITAGTGYGIDFSGNGATSDTLHNTGAITSTTGGGISFDCSSTSSGTNVFTNTATIQAGSTGINFYGPGTVADTFSNTGAVTSTNGEGLTYLGDDAALTSITNGGAISGGSNGADINVNGSTTVRLLNSAPITGHGGYGLSLMDYGAATSTVVNSGAISGTTEGLIYDTSGGTTSSFVNSGAVTGQAGDGIDASTLGVATTSFTNSAAVMGGTNGISLDADSSQNNTFVNSAAITGASGDGISILYQGTTTNTVNNTGTVQGSTAGMVVAIDSAQSTTVTNSGILIGQGGDALELTGGTSGTTSVVLPGGVEQGTTHSVEITAASAPTVSIIGRSKLNHDILNSGTTGVFNLDLVGVTPAEAAAINAMNGQTSGTITTTPGYTYTWENLTLNAQASSLESGVDPGLQAAARAIDTNGLPSRAFDPFYLAAVSNPEAALNLLVGREVDQAIDTSEVNQGTQLAYQVNNHLDGVGNTTGGFDLSGLQINTSSMLALAGTDSQLESLLNLGRFGGTEMSTDTKDAGRQMDSPAAPRWGGWAAGTVTLADSSTTGSVPGYHSTTGNPMLGLDYRVASDFVAGALVSYSTTGANFGDGSSLGAQTGIFGLYGAWHPGKWHLNTFIAGGYTSYDIDRTTFGGTANAHPSGAQAIGDATGGYDIDLSPRLRLIPELGLTYTYVGVDGYTEGNAGAFNLSKGGQDIDSLRSHAGGRLTASFPAFGGGVTFIPELRASYYHEFMDDSRGVTTSLPGGAALGAFPVQTASPERDFALVGAGLSTAFKGGDLPMAAFVNYDVQVGQSDYIAHNINAGLRVSF